MFSIQGISDLMADVQLPHMQLVIYPPPYKREAWHGVPGYGIVFDLKFLFRLMAAERVIKLRIVTASKPRESDMDVEPDCDLEKDPDLREQGAYKERSFFINSIPLDACLCR